MLPSVVFETAEENIIITTTIAYGHWSFRISDRRFVSLYRKK